jgi:hypothetical protein
VARDQVAVPGRHQIGLDVVRAELDCERVPLERVRRQEAMRAAVPNYERTALAFVPVIAVRVSRCNAANNCSRQQSAGDVADVHISSHR